MKLQELIDSTELEMTPEQIKAFFLGTLCAEKPLTFPRALDELLAETPESKDTLSKDLNALWDEITKSQKKALKDLFPQNDNAKKFLEGAKDQLDYFLMGMSLAGTSIDNCKNEDFATFLEEMEDCLEDIEDWLSEKSPDEEEGESIKEFLQEGWDGFVSSKK